MTAICKVCKNNFCKNTFILSFFAFDFSDYKNNNVSGFYKTF